MKKTLLSLAVLALVMAACTDPNAPDTGTQTPIDSVGNVTPEEVTSYARLQLIEHFTGAKCGYCPTGMDYIYEVYGKAPDKYVWVSNHYGYGSDEYSIAGSTTIGKKLGVGGAPYISVNRERVKTSDGTARAIHPYYTSTAIKQQSAEATTKITIQREYLAPSNSLHVVVLGETLDKTLSGVMLTLGLTESGMQGEQADYDNSWEGWTKFTHTHAIRLYASEALGDTVLFSNGKFTKEYDIQLNSEWIADNCELVAWVTAAGTAYPVLNASKLPVVEGTQGGENIKHGGVEMTPVPDYYPEPDRIIPKSAVEMNQAVYTISPATGYTAARIVAQNSSVNCGKYGTYGTMFPYVELYLFLPEGADSIANGTYNVASLETAQIGDVVAGYRDDAKLEVAGSLFYYLFNYNSSLYVAYEWMITSGALTVSNEGLSFTGLSRNGNTLSFSYAGTPAKAAPARVIRKAPLAF